MARSGDADCAGQATAVVTVAAAAAAVDHQIDHVHRARLEFDGRALHLKTSNKFSSSFIFFFPRSEVLLLHVLLMVLLASASY